jgi:Cell Wall Hydrolase
VNPPLADPGTQAELQLTRLHSLAAMDRFLMCAGIAVIVAFMIGLASGSFFSSADDTYQVTGSIGPLPPVEPLILKAVNKDVAKRTNDATPMTRSAVPAAPAFLFKGSSSDFERAADCLSATIFYEAGNEPATGQMAVAQVVLNRVRHPAYPKTVCGVVFQGHERRTGCQFSYTCDGAMSRRPSAQTWTRTRGIAQAMLKGLVYSPVGLATHYHTDWVLPVWSARLEKVRVEGTHLFFRYSGYWGTPAAYKGRISGTEPAYAKLSGLSVAHSGADRLDEALALTEIDLIPAEDAPMDNISTALAEDDPSKDTFIIYVDPLLEPAALTSMAQNACGGRKKCKVLAWADHALMPRGLPIDAQERSAIAFSYIQQPGKAGNKSRWNCALFPRDNASECLHSSQ